MVTRGDTGSIPELELLRAQRTQLANRLKAPWWYVAAIAFAWAVAFAMPIGSHYITGATIAGSLLVIVVFLVARYALVRVSGVNVGLSTARYPSGRVWTTAIVLIIFAADIAETLLLERGLLAAAITAGVLATVAGTYCWLGHMRAIRRDLEAGRGAA